MGCFYSLELRMRVAAFVVVCSSRRAAAKHFEVNGDYAIKLVPQIRDTR